jgi:uncharacterized protein
MEHYNGVARTLMENPRRYRPLFPIDERNGDVLWEVWVEGFDKAVRLRPAAWQTLLDADEHTSAAMAGMITLGGIVRGDRGAPQVDRGALTVTAPDDIARWMVTLNAWRIANYRPPPGASPMPRTGFRAAEKVGRNDPCPCGSGKKYKKCCGIS